MAILVSESVFLGYIAEYFFKEDPTPEETRDAYLFSAGLAVGTLTLPFVHAHGFQLGYRTAMDARIISTGAIYHKVVIDY